MFKSLTLTFVFVLAACCSPNRSKSPVQAVEETSITLTSENVVVLRDSVNIQSVNKVKEELSELSSRHPDQDLYLFLDTPGGSVIEGLGLIDFIRGLPNKVHTITQFSASMGYILVQNLDKRYVLRSGVLMSHRASMSGLSGTLEQIQSTIGFYGRMLDNIDLTCSNRIGIPLDTYKTLIFNDLWLDAQSSVAMNHADTIANVTCDVSLSGVYKQKVATMFGSYEVTFSKCPLFRGYSKAESSEGAYNPMVEEELFKRFVFRKYHLKYD